MNKQAFAGSALFKWAGDTRSETMDFQSQAIEEIRILQGIIARHEHLAFRVKGFFAAVVAGLAAATYSRHMIIAEVYFIILASTVYGSFVVWLLYHRAVVCRAAARVEEIEKGLWTVPNEAETSEAKPHRWKIVESLTGIRSWEIFGRLRDPQVLLPIAVGGLILFMLYLSVPSNTEVSVTQVYNQPQVILKQATSSSIDHVLAITVLLCVTGGVIVSLGRGLAATTAGFLLLLGGLQIVVIKELKLDSLINARFNFKGEDRRAVSKYLNDSLRFGAQYLGGVENFRTGRASIDKDGFEAEKLAVAKNGLKGICDQWGGRSSVGDFMVLIIGATDRLPLGETTRTRYEANTGLALARASAVRQYLASDCWTKSTKAPDQNNVVLLVSGPRNTPEVERGQEGVAGHGFPEDRRVDVWALTSMPASAIDTTTRPGKSDVGTNDGSGW